MQSKQRLNSIVCTASAGLSYCVVGLLNQAAVLGTLGVLPDPTNSIAQGEGVLAKAQCPSAAVFARHGQALPASACSRAVPTALTHAPKGLSMESRLARFTLPPCTAA